MDNLSDPIFNIERGTDMMAEQELIVNRYFNIYLKAMVDVISQ